MRRARAACFGVLCVLTASYVRWSRRTANCVLLMRVCAVYVCVSVLCVLCIAQRLQAGNQLGTEAAVALAPQLGKLTQLQTLNLGGE